MRDHMQTGEASERVVVSEIARKRGDAAISQGRDGADNTPAQRRLLFQLRHHI